MPRLQFPLAPLYMSCQTVSKLTLMYYWYMRDQDLPGHLKAITNSDVWLDYIFKSRLSSDHKLVAVVVMRTCVYNRQKAIQQSLLSNYTISRIVQKNSEQVQSILDNLVELGWLYDTGYRAGAKKIFVLTFSKIPLGESRT